VRAFAVAAADAAAPRADAAGAAAGDRRDGP